MRLEHTIRIDAPVDVVWAATKNITAWPDWTPTITSVQPLTEEPIGVGRGYLLKQPLQAKAVWEVTDLVEGKRFAWKKPGRFLRFQATHQLEATAGGTTNRLILTADGPGALLLRPFLRAAVARALVQENAGLKAFCEGQNFTRP